MKNEAWIKRQTETPEARRAYEQERLLLWATEALYEAMEAADLSKAELAERIGTSRAHVTQVLGGSRNMTLRTIADLAWACDTRVVMITEPLREGAYISTPMQMVRNGRPTIVSFEVDAGAPKGAGLDSDDELNQAA